MKNHSNLLITLLLLVGIISSCGDDVNVKIPKAPEVIDLTNSFYFEINLDDRSGDTFKVRMFADNLTADNAIVQFPATSPGTYDIHDIGRFVTSFKAFDSKHKELTVTHPSTNQWVLDDPENTKIIEFNVKETFDTEVTEHSIYKMAGTSLENSHALLNAFDVLPYPTGLKERDFYLNIDYPSNWSVGTSLFKDDNGYYFATDYDKLVDNPLLFGFITSASTTVDDATISVHTYSKNHIVQSSKVLSDIQSVLNDASKFLKVLPVDRYNFLFVFDEFTGSGQGALEHSYSSVYTFVEPVSYTTDYGNGIRNYGAHEFFHVVTPLNIHSEIIQNFNFADPTPSEHLWLYEGVTEWAAHTMQFRNGSTSLATWLSRFAKKKQTANYYKSQLDYVSLSEMSLTCYGDGSGQYGNVYYRGALVAALLDIRLLELSGGTKGLREIILELIETYGPENAFSEENFFNDFAQLTGYPTEITDFMDKYVRGTEELPIDEYFNKLGINYQDYSFTINPSPTAEQLAFRNKWSVNL